MRRLCLFTLALLAVGQLAAASALAASSEDRPLNLDVPAQAETASGGGGSILRTLFGLAIVVGVIFALYWILRQVRGGRAARAGGAGLETVATLPLGADRALHLVRVGNDLVLVGSSEHGVTSIRSYDPEEARALGMLDEPVANTRAPGTFDEPVAKARVLGTDGGDEGSGAVRLVEALRRLTVRR